MTVADEFQAMVNDTIKRTVEQSNSAEARQNVKRVLEDWIMVTARKKNVPDLAARIEEFRKRVAIFSENVDLTFSDGRLVVKSAGDAGSLVRMLERGTDWFDPIENATELIAGAILSTKKV